MAKILSANEHSVRFHRRFGFERVGVQRAVGQLGSRRLDVTIMQRVLEDEVPWLPPRVCRV